MKCLVATILFAAALSHGATIVVTDSVERALNEAHEGDTILLQGPRVFHERIVVNKSVRLMGTNSPTHDAGGIGTPLTLHANDVEIRGLNIRTFATGTREQTDSVANLLGLVHQPETD